MQVVIEHRDADGNNLGDEIVDYREEVIRLASEPKNPVLGALGSNLVTREQQGSAIAIVLLGLSVAGLAGKGC